MHNLFQILDLPLDPLRRPFCIRVPSSRTPLLVTLLFTLRLARLLLFDEVLQELALSAWDAFVGGESVVDVFAGESAADPGPVAGGFGVVVLGEEFLGVVCCYGGKGMVVDAEEDGGADGVGDFRGRKGEG